ncbi:hypothetical protein HOL24_14965 [bacterium]|jgi:L-Ala-D/L-Glu epimerase|nr:hypothetical protein [bacterium]
MEIRNIEILHATIPLKEPYILSFARIIEIDSIVVRITLENGGVGYSEAVPLLGYSNETKETIIENSIKVIKLIHKLDTSELESFLDEIIPNASFVISAFITAKEMALKQFSIEKEITLPLVSSLSSQGDIYKSIIDAHSICRKGYKTIKLKAGRKVIDDVNIVHALLDELPSNINLRIDINQGYTMSEAVQLLEVLNHPRSKIIEIIEQPFDSKDWKGFRQLTTNYPEAPLMLDESIIRDSDVVRAKDVGAKFIKLKLMKHKGLRGLIELGKQANKLGMKVIMGNGVASSIGNLIEASIFSHYDIFYGASESNGFNRLKVNTLQKNISIKNGNMIWRSSKLDSTPEINTSVFQIIFSLIK